VFAAAKRRRNARSRSLQDVLVVGFWS
jgi:hypothetical protein